jgi:hypothetical protein
MESIVILLSFATRTVVGWAGATLVRLDVVVSWAVPQLYIDVLGKYYEVARRAI